MPLCSVVMLIVVMLNVIMLSVMVLPDKFCKHFLTQFTPLFGRNRAKKFATYAARIIDKAKSV
jgi:hypothetical protein